MKLDLFVGRIVMLGKFRCLAKIRSDPCLFLFGGSPRGRLFRLIELVVKKIDGAVVFGRGRRKTQALQLLYPVFL